MKLPMPPDQAASTKKALRQHLREVIDAIPSEVLRERSVQACMRLVAASAYKRAEVIMVFLSLPKEVDTTTLVLQAWRDCKRVLAPRVSWEQRRMLPIELGSLSDNISEGAFGLREPAEGIPFPVQNIDLVVVPGLGFDREGNRIGRGRGFYDQFLAQESWRGIACGLALEDQVVEHVPTGEGDKPVDMLATDAQVRVFHRQARRP
jgi:5-formyltetrahydrofolate cyclo-ligase